MKLKGEPVELIAAREEELGYERNGADHKTPKTQEQIEEDVKNLYDSIPGKEKKRPGKKLEKGVENPFFI